MYPTETCYGLGADATNESAIEKVYSVKGREKTKAISIIISDLKMAKKYIEITKDIDLLVKRFMPGPLTLIAQKKPFGLPSNLSKKTIAFRIPANAFALKLIKKLNKPITATSANLSGQKELYKIKDTIQTFSKSKEIALIINSDDLPERKPSTIYDTINKKVLREGDVKEAEIKETLDF